jgi:hypothetical protein
MADRIRRADYFYFEIEDKPGQGARLLGQLADAGVSLLSFTAFPIAGGKTQVTVVPEKADALVTAASKAGLRHSGPKPCFLVQGENRVGAARELLKRLADANVNCTASNGTAATPTHYGLVLFVKPADAAAAARALGV